jgi:hypothetical protein
MSLSSHFEVRENLVLFLLNLTTQHIFVRQLFLIDLELVKIIQPAGSWDNLLWIFQKHALIEWHWKETTKYWNQTILFYRFETNQILKPVLKTSLETNEIQYSLVYGKHYVVSFQRYSIKAESVFFLGFIGN